MNSPLFDTHLATRNLERAYEAMWEQRELGLPPGHIGERWLPRRCVQPNAIDEEAGDKTMEMMVLRREMRIRSDWKSPRARAQTDNPPFLPPCPARSIRGALLVSDFRARGDHPPSFPSLTVVDPTQGALPPLRLEFDDGDATPPSPAGRRSTTAVSSGNAGKTGEPGRQTAAAAVAARDMTARAVEAAAAWEEAGTPEGAAAALTATGRLLAGNPLSVEALHLRGVALHLLKR